MRESFYDFRFGQIRVVRGEEEFVKSRSAANEEEFDALLAQSLERQQLPSTCLLALTRVESDPAALTVRLFFEWPKESVTPCDLAWFEAVEMFLDVLEAICVLRGKKMVHGDIRPDFIARFHPARRFKLLDRMGDVAPPADAQRSAVLQHRPLYMPPEAFEAFCASDSPPKQNFYKSDLFSLGMVSLEAFVPFDRLQRLYSRKEGRFDWLGLADIWADLDASPLEQPARGFIRWLRERVLCPSESLRLGPTKARDEVAGLGWGTRMRFYNPFDFVGPGKGSAIDRGWTDGVKGVVVASGVVRVGRGMSLDPMAKERKLVVCKRLEEDFNEEDTQEEQIKEYFRELGIKADPSEEDLDRLEDKVRHSEYLRIFNPTENSLQPLNSSTPQPLNPSTPQLLKSPTHFFKKLSELVRVQSEHKRSKIEPTKEEPSKEVSPGGSCGKERKISESYTFTAKKLDSKLDESHPEFKPSSRSQTSLKEIPRTSISQPLIHSPEPTRTPQPLTPTSHRKDSSRPLILSAEKDHSLSEIEPPSPIRIFQSESSVSEDSKLSAEQLNDDVVLPATFTDIDIEILESGVVRGTAPQPLNPSTSQPLSPINRSLLKQSQTNQNLTLNWSRPLLPRSTSLYERSLTSELAPTISTANMLSKIVPFTFATSQISNGPEPQTFSVSVSKVQNSPVIHSYKTATLNPSTAQQLNSSTPQQLNTSTPQPQKIAPNTFTPIHPNEPRYISGSNQSSSQNLRRPLPYSSQKRITLDDYSLIIPQEFRQKGKNPL